MDSQPEPDFKRCGSGDNVCNCKSESECGYLNFSDDEDDGCPHCGNTMHWEGCYECGGEGMTDDLYEEDPLWYDQGTYETCSACGGKGGWHICTDKECRETLTQNENITNI